MMEHNLSTSQMIETNRTSSSTDDPCGSRLSTAAVLAKILIRLVHYSVSATSLDMASGTRILANVIRG